MTREDREDAIDIIQSILDKYEEDECLVTEITIGDEDIKAFKMAIKALEQEPSSSEKPNKSIEEKCPCYHCEYFEIKGWSHCKIHEDAYGDSRCNDYHKVSQDLTKVKQDSNKSEIPTGSDDCISRQDVLSEIIRFSTEEGSSVECQQLYCDANNMPSVTPQEPRWIPVNERVAEFPCLACDIFDQIFIPSGIVVLNSRCYEGKDFDFNVEKFLRGKEVIMCGGKKAYLRPREIAAWMPLPEPYRVKGEKHDN